MQRRTGLMAAALAIVLTASADASPTSLASETPAATGPSVTVQCFPDQVWCEAYAWGGSGDGYSFDWYYVNEQYDANGYGWGYVDCYPFWGWRTVEVTVTDSNGHTGKASAYFYCEFS